MNVEIERGRGESVFPPNKDLGTRVGDQLGTGKNFPRSEFQQLQLDILRRQCKKCLLILVP